MNNPSAKHQSNHIKKIVIVGGGTAGWLAANHLAKKVNKPNGIEVCLIESKNIPTIGVGEGTVPAMRESLRYLGIDEGEFVKQCDVTFKQSIKFVDWTHDPTQKGSHYYHHLFDYPFIQEFNPTPYWLRDKTTPFANNVAIQAQICDSGLAPKRITHPQFQGATAYAYHLDAAKFSAMLTRHAVDNLGVEHIKTDVTQVNLAQNGDIKSVTTSDYGEIEADVFIDCTGFSSLLMGQALNIPFVDKSDVLFADHALAIQVPYDSADTPIASHTISTAKEAGWIWDIGLFERRGIGHVYSSSHTTHERAEQILRDYIGHQHKDLEARKIKMQVGYREKAWHKNCVALGLSQGFVEPLEATGLLVFDATARMLAEQFPHQKDGIEQVAARFNFRIRNTWDRVIDFIKLHYCISKRRDSDFWIDNTNPNSIPDSLRENLAFWRLNIPSEYDFHSKLEIFNLENYLYVLYGMEFDTDISAQSYRFNQQQQYQSWLSQLNRHAEQTMSQLPAHRELIKKIKLHGLQAI